MNIQCNLNNQFDFDIEPQLTARVEPDTVNKAKISPKQNYIIKRSPLVLYEEPNAHEIPAHRYLNFVYKSYWMNKILLAPELDLANAGTSRAIESRGKTTC